MARRRRLRLGASIAPAIDELRDSAQATRATAAPAPCAPGKRTMRLCIQRFGERGPTVNTPERLCEFVRRYLGDADREVFLAIHTDARHRVLAVEEVARGHLTGVDVHPREVLKGAMLTNAARIFVAHNHPSTGDPEPSPQDLALTRRLNEAANIVGIPLADHVVVGEGRCISMHERGIIEPPGGRW